MVDNKSEQDSFNVKNSHYEQDVLALKFGILSTFYKEQKLEKIIYSVTKYFKTHSLESVVVGVSGGLDSAVALAILNKVSERIPLKIYGVHIETSKTTTDYFNIIKKQFPNVEFKTIQLDNIYNEMVKTFEKEQSKENEFHIRYCLIYQALRYQAILVNGVVVGTTNKDELETIGWFGRNSDMMVDIQFLWEFHKCEILQIAKDLGVDREIRNRKYTGDIYSGETDEESFGCSYDELVWFKTFKSATSYYPPKRFDKVFELIDKNKFKYIDKKSTHYNPNFIHYNELY